MSSRQLRFSLAQLEVGELLVKPSNKTDPSPSASQLLFGYLTGVMMKTTCYINSWRKTHLSSKVTYQHHLQVAKL